MTNRAGARFCRRCGSGLAATGLKPGTLEPSDVELVSIKGRFRRPPVVVDGMLLALATDGTLHQISPRVGGRSAAVGLIGYRGAALNRSVAARVVGDGRNVRGWAYLAASADGIAAVWMATGTTEVLAEPRAGEQVSANRTEAEATGFRGMVANDEVYSFVTASPEGEFVLTIGSFLRDRPALRPLALSGSRLAGPVLHDGLLVMCTEEEAGIYDLTDRTAHRMPLPRGFTALLRPSSAELSVAPGSIPMVGLRGRDGGLRATLAGQQDGVPGTMELDFSRRSGEFQRRPSGSSVYSNADGSLSVSALDRVERIGRESTVEKVRSLEPGMPAWVDGGVRLWFAEQAYAGSHRVIMMRGSQSIEVGFHDPGCTKDTCCGIYLVGEDVVIASLPEGGSDAGLRLARWSLR